MAGGVEKTGARPETDIARTSNVVIHPSTGFRWISPFPAAATFQGQTALSGVVVGLCLEKNMVSPSTDVATLSGQAAATWNHGWVLALWNERSNIA